METGVYCGVSLGRAVKSVSMAALIGRMRRMDAGCRDARLLRVSVAGYSSVDAFTVSEDLG
jgi:hypothetical protein